MRFAFYTRCLYGILLLRSPTLPDLQFDQIIPLPLERSPSPLSLLLVRKPLHAASFVVCCRVFQGNNAKSAQEKRRKQEKAADAKRVRRKTSWPQMCRPIESRDSLGAMGPAAAALFAGYQHPSGNKHPANMMMNMANPKGLVMRGGSAGNNASSFPPWAASSPSLAPFGAESTNMMSMAAPPALPFVSFPKNLPTMPAMPWMNAPSTNNNASNNDLMTFGLNEDQFGDKQDDNDFEAAELEELLDFTMPDDLEAAEKDKEDLVNLDDGFDGTEMSILYSFLVDAPEEKLSAKKALELEEDDGILNLNMLTGSPIESLMESLDEDFTDDELKMSPRPSRPDGHMMKIKPSGEVKSRRLCRADGCYKRSRSNGMCISHGGGRRCAIDGCDKSSQGGNLCIRHGGGKRCSHDGCDKAAQSNFLCKAHGGGPRCQVDGCHRSSQGGGYCRSHGGGKRCMFDGCDKGTQRGDYCALHGGSRLCEVSGCMRNDRGGGLCATHGGGKRCTMDNCGKPCRRKGLCSAHLRQAEAK